MDVIIQGEWVADLKAMTCWNMKNGIIIHFKRKGHSLTGEIKHLPVELLQHHDDVPNNYEFIQKMRAEAEDIFLMYYFKKVWKLESE